ncbi:hypothetical protein K0M31_018698 [Melipona bicolor]|uniref:Uncharacterized protein n=1 Tax=Melipona bicolor TaxID=60889 RepID=A0AA40G3V8_9HYME|nr:hypothetical protein K0M31_018698 [Melipona bicolor]
MDLRESTEPEGRSVSACNRNDRWIDTADPGNGAARNDTVWQKGRVFNSPWPIEPRSSFMAAFDGQALPISQVEPLEDASVDAMRPLPDRMNRRGTIHGIPPSEQTTSKTTTARSPWQMKIRSRELAAFIGPGYSSIEFLNW